MKCHRKSIRERRDFDDDIRVDFGFENIYLHPKRRLLADVVVEKVQKYDVGGGC